MKVVFDSGIWISALEFGGTPAAALQHALIHGEIVMCTQIEEEVIRVLTEKFGRAKDEVRRSLSLLLKDTEHVPVAGTVSGVCRDPKDDFILECAINGGASKIVSGDKDLLSIGRHEKIYILTPRQYLERITEQRN